MIQTHTLIIGASVSGLATAASLQQKGISYTIIEKHAQAATPWRNHYKRLHLHTNKHLSNLPYKKFNSTIPRYPSREQVVEYLEDYQKAFNINPVFNTEAITIKKDAGGWVTETNNGIFKSTCVIIATGAFEKPNAIQLQGMETFTGKLIHSQQYKSGSDYTGKDVLVIGFGNSACEIAIDLYEQGARPSMSVRSAVNVIPRDVLGIPVLRLSLLMNFLSPRVADKINAPLLRLLTGDITKLGLKKLPYGPLEQIEKDGTAPVLDTGTLKLIREGHIKIYAGIDSIQNNTVFFKDRTQKDFDAIVTATGFYRNYTSIIETDKSRFDDLKHSTSKQKYFGKDGLYFCGFFISPTGQFREIALDAKKIAKDIAAKSSRDFNH